MNNKNQNMASHQPKLNEINIVTERNPSIADPAALADPENNTAVVDVEHGGSSDNTEHNGDLADPENDFNILADDPVYKTLPGAQIFRVSFAMHTAMPHLVILMKNNVREEWRSLHDLIKQDDGKCLTILYDIVGTVIDSFQLGSLDDMIVSFHVGSWGDNTVFRANLAIYEHKRKYIEIFNNFKNCSPMNSWWPIQSCVSKNWRIKKMSNIDAGHEANVYNNPTYNWRVQDIKKINPDKHKYAINFDHPDCKVVFHTFKPQIGLLWAAESSPEIPNQQAVLAEYTKLLYKLASDIIGTETEGCQICVSPTRAGFPLFDKNDDSHVFGYLQVSGLTFYKYCPLEMRDSWLQNYGGWNGLVYT